MAITLLTPREFKELQRIKTKVGTTMEHAYIPSKSSIKSANFSSIVESIEKHKVFDEAHKILDALREDIDDEQIIYKLISMIMDRQEVKGPNEIGINRERLEKILKNLERGGREGGGNRGRGSFRGNRNRSGGGGGYRGNRSSGGGYRGNRDRNRD